MRTGVWVVACWGAVEDMSVDEMPRDRAHIEKSRRPRWSLETLSVQGAGEQGRVKREEKQGLMSYQLGHSCVQKKGWPISASCSRKDREGKAVNTMSQVTLGDCDQSSFRRWWSLKGCSGLSLEWKE